MSQPTSFPIDDLLAKYQAVKGGLLPLLHAIQERFRYVPSATYPDIARALSLSVAEVHGVVSFYHHFRTTSPGRHILQVCRAESCQAMGSDKLVTHLKDKLDLHDHQTQHDISLYPVYCLGHCAVSPAIMLDDNVHGRVTPQMLDELLPSAASNKR